MYLIFTLVSIGNMIPSHPNRLQVDAVNSIINNLKIKDVLPLSKINIGGGFYIVKSNKTQKIIKLNDISKIDIEKNFGTYQNEKEENDYLNEVKRWKQLYTKFWYESLEYARQQKSEYLKQYIESAILHLDDDKWLKENVSSSYNPDLLKFFGSLSARESESIFENFKNIQPVKKGALKNSSKPFEKNYSELSNYQKQLIGHFFENKNKNYNFENAAISVYSSSGVGLEIGFGSSENPNAPRLNYIIGGESWGNEKLRTFADNYFFKKMSKVKTPDTALLGVKFTESGVDRYLFGQDEKISMKTRKVSFCEFLNLIKRQLNVDIISDSYTTGSYVEINSGQNGILLSDAAKQLKCVFRIEGKKVYCRNIEWPILDIFEIDFPMTEKWISYKEKKKSLTLKHILDMSKIEKEKTEALYDYNDGDFDFKHEIDIVIGNPSIHGSEYMRDLFFNLAKINDNKEINFQDFLKIEKNKLTESIYMIARAFNCGEMVRWIKFEPSMDKMTTILKFYDSNKKELFKLGFPFILSETL